MKLLITLTCTTALTTAALAQKYTRLTGAELQALLPGATMSATNRYGQPFSQKFSGGSVHGQSIQLIEPHLPTYASGNWEVKGDQVCIYWDKWPQSCFGLEGNGATYRYAPPSGITGYPVAISR
jgi:hypothetical protein